MTASQQMRRVDLAAVQADRVPPGRRWVSAEAWLQRVARAEAEYEASLEESADRLAGTDAEWRAER